MEKKLIVVTGFGPFEKHEEVNASWEAVRLIPDEIQHNQQIYKIEKILIPVIYKEVDKVVDEIWKKNPDLVIHCGVHGGAACIHVEKFAYNSNFCKSDFSGQTLSSSTICLQNNGEYCQEISTNLDVDKIVQLTNSSTKSHTTCISSTNIGSYLCGYIYLKSLDINPNRSIFLHVPCIDKPFTSKQTCDIIFEILKFSLAQIH